MLALIGVFLCSGMAFGQVYERSETLYVSGAAWGPPTDWNPFIAWSKANTSGTVGLMYETLFMYDPLTDEMQPWLAKSGEWVASDVYLLKLREGIKWSDGVAFTADDVKFTFELGEKYAALFYSPMWKWLKGIGKVDDYTLKFNFSKPLYQEWGNNLYNIPIVPKHIWEGRTEEDITAGANKNPVGSGAYLYESHSADRNVYLRNEDWWATSLLGLKPAPRRIVDIRVASNNDTKMWMATDLLKRPMVPRLSWKLLVHSDGRTGWRRSRSLPTAAKPQGSTFKIKPRIMVAGTLRSPLPHSI